MATPAIEATGSHQWSNVAPGWCSTTPVCAIATVTTTAIVSRVPKKLAIHSTDHAYMTAPLPGGLVATTKAISTTPIGPSANISTRWSSRPPKRHSSAATANEIAAGIGELVALPATMPSSAPTAAAPAYIAAPDLATIAVPGGRGSVPDGSGMSRVSTRSLKRGSAEGQET